jgi:nucleotide-binding universal stress UspA family protein
MLKNILVPLDGSDLSEKALKYAQAIVPDGGKIHLLSVVDTPEYPTSIYYPAGLPSFELAYSELQRDVIPQTQEYLEKVAETLRQQGIHVVYKVTIGEPAATIIEYVRDFEISAVVMSTHGRSGLSRWLFGSVAQKVLSVVNCPVFVIPAKTS